MLFAYSSDLGCSSSLSLKSVTGNYRRSDSRRRFGTVRIRRIVEDEEVEDDEGFCEDFERHQLRDRSRTPTVGIKHKFVCTIFFNNLRMRILLFLCLLV